MAKWMPGRAQHDAGAATQPQQQIEEESRDFKSSFCEFRYKKVKCHNVEDLSGKQNEGREWVKSHFMPWAGHLSDGIGKNDRTRLQQREPTLTANVCG